MKLVRENKSWRFEIEKISSKEFRLMELHDNNVYKISSHGSIRNAKLKASRAINLIPKAIVKAYGDIENRWRKLE